MSLCEPQDVHFQCPPSCAPAKTVHDYEEDVACRSKKDSCMRAPAKTVHDYEEDVACRSKKTVACMPGSEEREIEIRTPPETVLIVKRSSRDNGAMQRAVDTRTPGEA